jgi:hypothetical protein
LQEKKKAMIEGGNFSIPQQLNQGIIVYEYGVRIDKNCEQLIWQQISGFATSVSALFLQG